MFFDFKEYKLLVKVHIFWEGNKILQNLHLRFVLCSTGQIYGGDFAKFCGLIRTYELYNGVSMEPIQSLNEINPKKNVKSAYVYEYSWHLDWV